MNEYSKLTLIKRGAGTVLALNFASGIINNGVRTITTIKEFEPQIRDIADKIHDFGAFGNSLVTQVPRETIGDILYWTPQIGVPLLEATGMGFFGYFVMRFATKGYDTVFGLDK